MERLKLFLPLLIFMVLATVLYWGLGKDPNAMPSVLVGRPVPEFNLPSIQDDKHLLGRNIFEGNVTLLNIWATWCPSCRIEHSYLLNLAAQGVAIIGLDYKDETDKARRWLKELGNPYRQVIVDREGSLGLDLGVFGAPETYLIDATGVIRYKHVGVIDERVWQGEFVPLYRKLLKETERDGKPVGGGSAAELSD